MPSILKTKLHRPAGAPRRVGRAQLMRRLHEGLALGRPVTLVSAPAGFGKTTCVSEWLDELDLPAAWLSLDAGDNEPGRFFSHLVAALQGLDERLGKELEGLLRGGQLPPAEVIAGGLLNDLLETPLQRVLLVLDDFHVLQEGASQAGGEPGGGPLGGGPPGGGALESGQGSLIFDVLERLLASPPPALHLVLLTREDPALPLARLRAGDRLTEIRAADLRFDRAEIGRFLGERMGLAVPDEDIAALEERTEGWIAGVQLAALAMQSIARGPGGQAGLSAFIARLSGSHRFILSYLTEEVLNRQPPEVQQFLLQTAILNRLSGELCAAVTGRADAPALLERLYNDNLFLIPLDDEQHWYRYHHLFADLLRDRQKAQGPGQPGEPLAELHRRASRWYAQAGEGAAQPGRGPAKAPGQAELREDERIAFIIEAVQHALAAADYPAALGLIETHAMPLLMQWYARTVSGWLLLLPPEWVAQSPRVSLAFAWMHLMRGDFTQAVPYLARLEAFFAAGERQDQSPAADADTGGRSAAVVGPQSGGPQSGGPQSADPQTADPRGADPLRAGWLALQAMLLNAQGQARPSLELARQALALAPAQDALLRSQVYLEIANACKNLEDIPGAVEAYQQSAQSGRAAAAAGTPGGLGAELMGISALALLLIERGQLHYAYELAAQGAERAERAGVLLPVSTGLYGELGQIHYHWLQLDRARDYLQRATQCCELSGFSDGEIYFAVFLSRLRWMEGDLDAAARHLQRALERMHANAPAVVREEVIAQQVRVCLAQGRLAAAEAALQGLAPEFNAPSFEESGWQATLARPELAPGGLIAYPVGLLYNTALRILLHRARVGQPAGEPAAGGAPGRSAAGVPAPGESATGRPADEAADRPVLHPPQGFAPLSRGIALAERLTAALLQRRFVSLALETLLLRTQLHQQAGEAEAALAAARAALELGQAEGYISSFVEEGPQIARALASLADGHRLEKPTEQYARRILEAFASYGMAKAAEAAPSALPEPLTPRELETLRLIAAGLKYEEIAARLVVSLNTVRSHVKAIYGKLGVNGKMEAVERAREVGVL